MTVHPFHRPFKDPDPTRRYTLQDGVIRPVPWREPRLPELEPREAATLRDVLACRSCTAVATLAPVPPEIRVVEVEVPAHWSTKAGWFCAGILFPFLIGLLR